MIGLMARSGMAVVIVWSRVSSARSTTMLACTDSSTGVNERKGGYVLVCYEAWMQSSVVSVVSLQAALRASVRVVPLPPAV